eukprot:254339_1
MSVPEREHNSHSVAILYVRVGLATAGWTRTCMQDIRLQDIRIQCGFDHLDREVECSLAKNNPEKIQRKESNESLQEVLAKIKDLTTDEKTKQNEISDEEAPVEEQIDGHGEELVEDAAVTDDIDAGVSLPHLQKNAGNNSLAEIDSAKDPRPTADIRMEMQKDASLKETKVPTLEEGSVDKEEKSKKRKVHDTTAIGTSEPSVKKTKVEELG